MTYANRPFIPGDNYNAEAGTAEFPGLFDQDGNRVRARIVYVRNYEGTGEEPVWLLVDENGEKIDGPNWIRRPSNVTNPSPRSKMGQLGYHEETEAAPAELRQMWFGSGYSGRYSDEPKRADGGFPVEVTA